MIRSGETAPDFTLPATGGRTVTLSALRGRRVVLYFYPKDSTPACTLENQEFDARAAEFAAAGAVVLGISKDSLRRHENFCRKAGLGATLLSDEHGDTCERYGVWAEKQMMGRRFMGIVRSTFLIAPDGTVARVWSPVTAAGHAAEVLAAVLAEVEARAGGTAGQAGT